MTAGCMVGTRFDDLGCDGASVRFGIMGGTFDPIHYGHLICAEQAREVCGLDAVVFIPTGDPNFKRDRELADAQMRLEMCRLACLPNPHFDVSDMEIARGGITYTIDTARTLREHFPENVELFLIVGADALGTIGTWRESPQIAQLFHVIAVERPGYAVSDSLVKQLSDQEGYDIVVVKANALDISSSDVRRRIACGLSVRYLLPPSVRIFIKEKGLYRVASSDADAELARGQGRGTVAADAKAGSGACIDALSDEFYEARASELPARVSEKRLHHIMGVAQAAVMLAQSYGIDERKARLAGLLHDWDKGYDDEGIRRRIAELGIVDELDPWVVEHMPGVLHGPTAAAALARDFPEIPDDVIQAIDRHTTAAMDMDDLDKVVYVADAIEESRQYGRIDELRALVGTVSLDDLFFSTYEYWTTLLLEREKPLHPDTMAIWNAQAAQRAARKAQRTDGSEDRGNREGS